MNGIIETVLTHRFGPPVIGTYEGIGARIWNPHDEARRCTLLVGAQWDTGLAKQHRHLQELYGNSSGGFVLGNMLKLSSLTQSPVWGVHAITEFQACPAVRRALVVGPKVDYCMDSANVWFYGYQAGSLYCYDVDNDDAENLGEAEAAMDVILSHWLDAIA